MTDTRHTLPDRFLHRAIRIHVVGCGGTGSQLVPRLPHLHKSMLALGHASGLDVTVWDSDQVSESNCVRQNFFTPDIGKNKASVMVNRLNLAHGLDWKDEPRHFNQHAVSNQSADFIIGCVDTKASRRAIDQFVRNAYEPVYWIDAGNTAHSAQMIVGQWGRKIADDPLRLPLVTELYPEIITGADDNTPSCSARESIARQGVATNAMAACWIFAWLGEAIRHGSIGYCGLFFNLETGRANSIPICPTTWDAIRPPAPVDTKRKAA